MMDLWPYWEPVWTFANTNFGAALVAGGLASLAGALGGALAAQGIADKRVRRKQLSDEIKSCNAGLDAAGATLNSFLNLKGQLLVDLKRGFDQQRAAVHAHALAMDEGRVVKGQRLELGGVDHGSLPQMRVPVDRLEIVMMEQLSISGRPRGLTNMVLQSVERANEMIRERNEIIQKLKGLPTNEMVARVFGLPSQGGVDNTYGDCVQGVWKYSNDVIYFTRELCIELMKYGKKVEKRYKSTFKGIHPKTMKMNFDTPEAIRLMPPDADYASWEGTYELLVSPTEDRRLGKAYYALRRRTRRVLRKPWKWKKAA